MRNRFLILVIVGLQAGCTVNVPDFLGRDGAGTGNFQIGGDDAAELPDPIQVPLRSAEAERALHGVILRVEGVAPTQGYYGAVLLPASAEPDAAGIMGFELMAFPPEALERVGPERTRLLTAAVFFPNLAMKDLRGFRVAGAGTVRTLPLR